MEREREREVPFPPLALGRNLSPAHGHPLPYSNVLIGLFSPTSPDDDDDDDEQDEQQ